MTPRIWTVTKDKFLSREEVLKLYSALKDARDLAIQRRRFLSHVRDYYLLRTLLETGLRAFELTALKVSDFCNKSLIVQYGKGGKPRTILLTVSTQKILREFLKIKRTVLRESTVPESFLFLSERKFPYTTRGLRKRVKLWFTQCGLGTHLSVHSCRHSYISHLIAAGVDLPIIRDNAGHSSLAVTSIYSHAVKDDLGELDLYGSDFSRNGNASKKQSRRDEEF